MLPQLVKSSRRELDIKYVATNDIHYVKKRTPKARTSCFAYRQTAWSQTETAMKMSADEFYLKSEDELRGHAAGISGGI